MPSLILRRSALYRSQTGALPYVSTHHHIRTRINIFLLVNCATVLSFYTVLFYCTRQWWPKLHENWPIWPFLRHFSAGRVQNSWPPALSFYEVLWGHYGCVTLHFVPFNATHEKYLPLFVRNGLISANFHKCTGHVENFFFGPSPSPFGRWSVCVPRVFPPFMGGPQSQPRTSYAMVCSEVT